MKNYDENTEKNYTEPIWVKYLALAIIFGFIIWSIKNAF